MKNDPGEIISEIEIDLPSERDESTFTSEHFDKLRTKITTAFKHIESQKLSNLAI